MGAPTELGHHICTFRSPFIHQQHKTRLASSSSLFECSNRFHRLRTEKLHRSIKKIIKKYWKWKKLEQKVDFEKFWPKHFRNFSDPKIWKFENLEHLENHYWKIYEIFEIFDLSNFEIQKFSKIFDQKFSKYTFCSNFFRFQKKMRIFFNGSM